MSKYKIILFILIVLGFIWRYLPMSRNYSFWTDEEHVAVFSRAVLEKGQPVLSSGFNIGIYQLPMYWLGVIGLKLFGNSEIAIRWPSLIFGTVTLLAVYLLTARLFTKTIGLLSVFFTAFLNIEILWSIQARPYQAIQFFWILGTFFSFKFLEDRKIINIFLAALCGLLSVLFHPLGVMFFAFQLVFYSYLWLWESKNKHVAWGIGLFLVTGAVFFRIIPTFFNLLKRFGQFNNFFYYRVFLTHNYLPLVLFCFLGFYFLVRKKKSRELVFFTIVLGLQTFVVSFLAPQPFTRYFYPILPFIIILASYGIFESGGWIQKNIKYKILNSKYSISALLILLMIFSLWKTDKLSLFPQKVYSLNADMKEIPEVDWKKLYGFVGEKLKLQPDAVLVSNWMDTPVWFLGEGKLDYLLRKNEEEKDYFSGAVYLKDLVSFKNVIKENASGVVVLDSWDMSVPEGIREFSRDTLKKELEIDRLYPDQPRYWPVSVYSWGI